MKKLSFILIITLLAVFTGCKDNIIGDVDPLPETNFEPNLNKRGVGYSNKNSDWSNKTSALGAHWMYSWGNVKKPEVPDNVEFVPMFWGKGSVTTENIASVKERAATGEVKFVLGFNEPDGTKQANMTVDEAIALWPELETIGVPLVSPATVNPKNDWMQDFMQKAKDNNLRIDYVAVHHYGGASVTAFIDKLRTTYEMYGLPIWITEFAVADWNATSPENNKYSTEEVAAFMEEVLPALDEIEWIYRYAWFDGSNAALHTSALYDELDNITTLGQIYADHSPNVNIGPGTDVVIAPPADPDELIVNGDFESESIAPWGGFKNGVVGAATTEPYEGNNSGRIQNGDGSLFQVVSVEPGKSYEISFYSKWLEAGSIFSPIIKDNTANVKLFDLPNVPTTTVWEQSTFQFTVPDGVTELKIVFYKINGTPPFFLDNVSLLPVP